MKIPANPESVRNFLEDGGLDFINMINSNVPKERSLIPYDSIKGTPIKPSECNIMLTYTLFNLGNHFAVP